MKNAPAPGGSAAAWPFLAHRTLAEVSKTEELMARSRAGALLPQEVALLRELLARWRASEALG